MRRMNRPLPKELSKDELNTELNRVMPEYDIDWRFLRVRDMRELIRRVEK